MTDRMPASPKPDIRLHHVSIAVTDIDKAIAFWTDSFGFDVLERFRIEAIDGNGAFVGNDHFQLELWQLGQTKPVPEERKRPNSDLLTAGTKHVAFRVRDLPGVVRRLQEKGVTIVAAQRNLGEPMLPAAEVLTSDGSGPLFAVFIHDPFGSLVELWDDPG